MGRTSSNQSPSEHRQRCKWVVAAVLPLLCQAPIEAASPSTITNPVVPRNLVERAHAGQAQAQLILADYLYANGNFTNAAGWYRLSAEQGVLEAQLAYATCLVGGRGVKQNPAEAARWSQVIAGRVVTPTVPQVLNGRVLFKLAELHASRGDATNAARWYRVAAERGHVEAQLALAECYNSGRGVAKDPQEAKRWSRLAASAPDTKTPAGPGAGSPLLSTVVPSVPTKTGTVVPAIAREMTSARDSSSNPGNVATSTTSLSDSAISNPIAAPPSSSDVARETSNPHSKPLRRAFAPQQSPNSANRDSASGSAVNQGALISRNTTSAAAVSSPPVGTQSAQSERRTTNVSASIASLVAAVIPEPVPVAARELSRASVRTHEQDSSVRPNAEGGNSVPTGETLLRPSNAAAESVTQSTQQNERREVGSSWLRLTPEDIGPGIRFRRITDLPPLVPEVPDERAVIRPLIELR